MPILPQAKKALRQSEKRHKQNLARRRAYKQAIKRVKVLVDQGETDQLEQALSSAYKVIDKAAKAGAIHANKAARLKSRLSKKLQ